jgi:hypothetical protein
MSDVDQKRRLDRERRRLERERIRRGQACYMVWVPSQRALLDLLIDEKFLHPDHDDNKQAVTHALELYLARQCRA